MHSEELVKRLRRCLEGAQSGGLTSIVNGVAALLEEALAVGDGQDKYKAICVDLDGVLAEYKGFTGHYDIGAPLIGAEAFLRALKARDLSVIIFTTRGYVETENWLTRYDLLKYVTFINENPTIKGNNSGKPVACWYVDDRAVRFRGNFDMVLAEIDDWKDWWRK